MASARDSSSALKRRTAATRSSRGRSAQSRKAARAAATARSASAGEAVAPSHTTSPVAGSVERRGEPEPSAQRPSM